MTQSIAFDRAATFYDDTRGFPPGVDQEAAQTILQASKLAPTSRILEIGIGTGRIALPLAKHLAAIYGLDLSVPMMLRLQTKQSDEPIYLVQGDATRLPYPDHRLDAVLAVHVFHLIPSWQAVIAELARVLKPAAPVIHCWSENDEVFKVLWDAWRAAIPNDAAADVGLRWEKNEGALEALGWKSGDSQAFLYTYGRSPAAFVNQLENRIWSQTWRLSDESLARGVAAVKAVVAREYPNPTAEISVQGRFVARTYYPPQ